jgi:hypothetical protein
LVVANGPGCLRWLWLVICSMQHAAVAYGFDFNIDLVHNHYINNDNDANV